MTGSDGDPNVLYLTATAFRRTNADSSNQVLEPVATKHAAEHLLGVLESLLITAAAVLLSKLVVLLPQVRVREYLVCDSDLLELIVSGNDLEEQLRLRTFSSASGSSRFWQSVRIRRKEVVV